MSPLVGERHVDHHVGEVLGDRAGQSDLRAAPHVGDDLDVAVAPSGVTGRWANREPDHALMTASLAAHRAARCRAATELLSAASRRSPG